MTNLYARIPLTLEQAGLSAQSTGLLRRLGRSFLTLEDFVSITKLELLRALGIPSISPVAGEEPEPIAEILRAVKFYKNAGAQELLQKQLLEELGGILRANKSSLRSARSFSLCAREAFQRVFG